MDYIQQGGIEFNNKPNNIFSGGVNVKETIHNNHKISNIKTNENYDKFSDLFIPIGLQHVRYNNSINVKNTYNDNMMKDSTFDKLLTSVTGKKIKNTNNKTRKKTLKKNSNKIK